MRNEELSATRCCPSPLFNTRMGKEEERMELQTPLESDESESCKGERHRERRRERVASLLAGSLSSAPSLSLSRSSCYSGSMAVSRGGLMFQRAAAPPPENELCSLLSDSHGGVRCVLCFRSCPLLLTRDRLHFTAHSPHAHVACCVLCAVCCTLSHSVPISLSLSLCRPLAPSSLSPPRRLHLEGDCSRRGRGCAAAVYHEQLCAALSRAGDG